MKIKLGTSTLLFTETDENIKLIFDIEKLKGRTRSVVFIIGFSIAAALLYFGLVWLAMGLFITLVTLMVIHFFRHMLDFPMDFELEPELAQDILNDVLVEGR